MAEYIERESIIAHMKDLPTWWADDGGVYGKSMKYPDGMFDCEDVIGSLEGAPAADVEPVRRGKWLNTRAENKKMCSCCGIIHFIAQYPFGKINYCPNCGARMDAKMGGEENG